jgi:hypothetical protein
VNKLWNALWAAGLIWVLARIYLDASAPGHDNLVAGVWMCAADPAGVLWVVIGGLAFWFGMRMRWGGRR